MIKRIRNLITCRRGVTYIEVMLAITLLAISMTYIAYDSKHTSKRLYELNEKDHMLYAAQEAVERYKLDQNGGTKTINGYRVDISSAQGGAADPNLTSYLKRVSFIVYPKDVDFGISNLEIISYVFSPSINPPQAPTNLFATAAINSVILNWNSVNYADTYNIKRSTSANGPYTVIATGVGANVYTDTSVTAGVTYYYIVTATNIYGEGLPSNQSSTVMVFNTVNLEPVADSYVRDGTWYAGSNYGSDQKLYISGSNKKGGTYKAFIKFDISSIQGIITDAKIRLYGNNTSANKLAGVNIKTLGSDSWTENSITWNNSPADGSTIGALNFTGTASYAELNTRDYVVNKFGTNKLVSFVITTNSNDLLQVLSRESAYKPQLVITTTPMTSPVIPQNVKGIPDDKKSIIRWDVSIGASSYSIKRSTNAGGPYTTVKTGITSLTYIDIGLTNGTSYYYVVSAVNSTGESNNSTEVCVIPSVINTIILTPEDDSFTRDGSYSSTNYGSSAKLELKNGTSGEKRIGYMKFNLSNIRGTVTSAKIRMFGSNIDDASNVRIGLYDIYGASWEEDTIVSNNSPLIDDQFGTMELNNTQGYREIDVTDYINSEGVIGGIFDFAIGPIEPGKLISVNSKESLINKPELVITKTLLRPDAPANLTAVGDDKSVAINWSPSLEASSYSVKRSMADGGPYSVVAGGLTGTSYTDNTVANGITYYYIVTASNASGESTNSNQISSTPNVSITATLNPIADAKVESYYPNNNFGTNTALETAANTTNTKKSYLKFDMTGYSINTVLSAKLRLYGNSNINSYKLNVYGVSNNTWIESGTGAITSNTSPVFDGQIGTTLVNTTKQYYEVDITSYVASRIGSSGVISLGLFTDVNSNNNSLINSRESLSGKPELVVKMIQGIPKAPTGLNGTGESGVANLTWNASNGAASYKVKRGIVKGGPYTTIASNVAVNSYKDTAVSNGTSYYYVVSAVSAGGESGNSNEVCVIPIAAGSTQIVLPVADSFSRDGIYSNANSGGTNVINVSKSSISNDGNNRDGYLKFDLSTVNNTLKTATLNIWGNNTTGNKNTTVALNIYLVSNDVWDEFGINYGNAPASSTLINSFTVNKQYNQVSIDLTSFVKSEISKDKSITLCIKGSTIGYVSAFSSREGTNSPRILINY